MEIVTATLVVGIIGLIIGLAGCDAMENNLARIDPDKCTGCGVCAQKCPAKVISGGDVRIEAAAS